MPDPAKRERGIIRALKRRLKVHPNSRKLKKSLARHRDALLRLNPPLRERAYRIAESFVGVMEVGSNNRGPEVDKLIREGGGIPGQAWCGWFQAVCYKRAGSKAVDWHWGAVRLLFPLPKVYRTLRPRRGDLVRFTFDHVGMFVKDNGDGYITTVEGNTGASGAVSDSKTGGDGVYVKTRSKTLVRDYLRVRA